MVDFTNNKNMKFIAEIGLNHCGSVERANEILEDLCGTSVNIISFQIRESSFYDNTHPRKVELPLSFYVNAIARIHRAKKLMCIAIADYEKISQFDDIGVDQWKTLSWDLSNDRLIGALQKTNKKIYVSTGISSMKEIQSASKKWKEVEFIHTQLNDLIDSTNLQAIHTIREFTGHKVAFGLHCTDHEVLYCALAFKPSAIFFYVKDETDEEHPDDLHAIPTGLVEERINMVNKLNKSLGNGEKNAMENNMHPDDDNICN